MIVRILGQGQYEIDEGALRELNALDERLVDAIDAGDDKTFRQELVALLEGLHAHATALPDDYLGPSDAVLPAPDATLDDVRNLLGDEGLIPG